jgi:chromosomal replication initiation ATPase DnaA
MGEPPRQLALDLPVEERLGSEDFLVSRSNEAAYAAVESWPDWPGGVLLLVGAPGSGKSHLAAIWASRSQAWTTPRAALTDAGVPHLVSAGALVIEDCDASAGGEAALFHLLNASRDRGATLLLTAAKAPDAWGLATPDLLSRLRLAPTVRIEPPDDALIRAVLVKLLVERQLVVDTAVVEFLAQRMERSVSAARDLIERLDRAALARQRRITRALATEILQSTSEPAGIARETRGNPG